MKLLYRISFLSLLFVLLFYLNTRSQQANSPAYNILLPNPNGRMLSLDKNVGKYVYLHFWASWCEQSLTQLPILNDIYANYYQSSFDGTNGFEIYSVSLDADKNQWLSKLSQNQLIWPQQVCDFKGYASPVCRQYQVTSTPTSFLISPNGTIIAQNISPKELEFFLAEKKSKARYGSSRSQLIQTFSQNANQPTYKIQLGVFKYPNLQKFAHIQHLGQLETETTPEGYTRITLGSFGTEAETKAVLAQIKNQENCQQAFVVAVPNDILPATHQQKDDFWANAQNYNTGIKPHTSPKSNDESTFYDQEFKTLMSQPIVEKVPETVVPDFGISDDVFVKEDNRQVKVTVYAPKEQPPAIRIVENVQNETLSVPSIANNNTYNARQTTIEEATSKKRETASFIPNIFENNKPIVNTTNNKPTPNQTSADEVNVAYGVSESYTKPNEIGSVITKTYGKVAQTVSPSSKNKTVATTTDLPKSNAPATQTTTNDIPTYDYNAALERAKKKEDMGKAAEAGKNWVAPEYYPSEHNKEWRDYSVANKANEPKTNSDWNPKNQSAVPAPPKVEKKIIVESNPPAAKTETYNYENKKKNSKEVKAIPNSENFKWEPKKSHTYPTTYPRKETELPLHDNVDIPKYEYPKELMDEEKKKKDKSDAKAVLEQTNKMTRKEKRKKKRKEKRNK